MMVAALRVSGETLAAFAQRHGIHDGELATAAEGIHTCDVIAGVDIRAVLRALGVDPGPRRLGELGPQKSLRLDRGGRTLQITTAMLIQGSCGIGRPLGDPIWIRRAAVASRRRL